MTDGTEQMTEHQEPHHPPLFVSFGIDAVMSVIRHALRADMRINEIDARHAIESPDGFFDFEDAVNVILRFDPSPPSLLLESDGAYMGKMPEGVSETAVPIQWNPDSLEHPHLINALHERSIECEGVQCGFAFHINAGDLLQTLRTHHQFVIFEISHRFVRYYGVSGFDLDCLQFR